MQVLRYFETSGSAHHNDTSHPGRHRLGNLEFCLFVLCPFGSCFSVSYIFSSFLSPFSCDYFILYQFPHSTYLPNPTHTSIHLVGFLLHLMTAPQLSRLYIQVSRGECARLGENVPYVKVHRYNPKHLHISEVERLRR